MQSIRWFQILRLKHISLLQKRIWKIRRIASVYPWDSDTGDPLLLPRISLCAFCCTTENQPGSRSLKLWKWQILEMIVRFFQTVKIFFFACENTRISRETRSNRSDWVVRNHGIFICSFWFCFRSLLNTNSRMSQFFLYCWYKTSLKQFINLKMIAKVCMYSTQ